MSCSAVELQNGPTACCRGPFPKASPPVSPPARNRRRVATWKRGPPGYDGPQEIRHAPSGVGAADNSFILTGYLSARFELVRNGEEAHSRAISRLACCSKMDQFGARSAGTFDREMFFGKLRLRDPGRQDLE